MLRCAATNELRPEIDEEEIICMPSFHGGRGFPDRDPGHIDGVHVVAMAVSLVDPVIHRL